MAQQHQQQEKPLSSLAEYRRNARPFMVGSNLAPIPADADVYMFTARELFEESMQKGYVPGSGEGQDSRTDSLHEAWSAYQMMTPVDDPGAVLMDGGFVQDYYVGYPLVSDSVINTPVDTIRPDMTPMASAGPRAM